MPTSAPRFWLTWSLRDLRRRWSLIMAISLLLAGGTGLAAGLGSMRDWRVDSNDASFAALQVHDLRVEAEEGSFAPAGSLARAARQIPDADALTAVSERLILPTQIDATGAADGTVITPGQLIGVETGRRRMSGGVETTGPAVDSVAVEQGEGLPAGGPDPVGLLDPEFAEENGIETPARIKLAGAARSRSSAWAARPRPSS